MLAVVLYSSRICEADEDDDSDALEADSDSVDEAMPSSPSDISVMLLVIIGVERTGESVVVGK